MSEDRRGFVYPLAPVLLQAQWQLDALQRELSASAQRLAALRADGVALAARHVALVHAARPSTEHRFDPSRALSRLAYLSDLQRRMAANASDVAAAETAHASLLAKVAASRLKLDAIERDGERCLQAYIEERARQSAIAADQDWLARASWRHNTVRGPTEAR